MKLKIGTVDALRYFVISFIISVVSLSCSGGYYYSSGGKWGWVNPISVGFKLIVAFFAMIMCYVIIRRQLKNPNVRELIKFSIPFLLNLLVLIFVLYPIYELLVYAYK
jgi:hypothetical protein